MIYRSLEWPRIRGLKASIKSGFKNGDEKVVPLSPDAQRVLEELKQEQNGKAVFNLNGKFLEYRFITHAYDSAAKIMNLDFTGTHVMRTTGASWLLKQTGDIDLAKQLLGNSTWSSVTPYAQRESKAIKDFNYKLWNESENPEGAPEPAAQKLRLIR